MSIATPPEEKLAIHGGPKVKTTNFGVGKRFDGRELGGLSEVIESQQLFYWGGAKSAELARKAAAYFDAPYATLTSSGTAALHVAIASCRLEPGYEVITSPITDYGTLIGLLYQNLIPVFADVDPHTYNLTAETIRARLTPRTRAIIAVHLAGNPCEMDEINALAREHGIPVIEDCAQSYNAIYKSRKAGALGSMGCFSLNAFKHISSGDGGFVLSHDEATYHAHQNYADKFYDRHATGARMKGLAPCYRITELQSACALVQLDKLQAITERRNHLGSMLTERLRGIDGVYPHQVHAHNRSSYWFYMLRIDPRQMRVSRNEFSAALTAEGVPASAGYIARPMYLEDVFVEKSFFPGVWPAEVLSGKAYSYHKGLCPVAEEVLETAIRLPINEFFSDGDIEEMGRAIVKVARACRA